MSLTVTDHLRKVLRHEQWATRRILAAMSGPGAAPPRAIRLMSHIIGAQLVWLARIEGESTSQPVWPEWTLGELSEQAQIAGERWTAYLATVTDADLDRPVIYTNSKGDRFDSTLHDILTHLGIHAAYHRGQVNASLREADIAPPVVDYIHATRTKGV